jgi:hypothetical protein
MDKVETKSEEPYNLLKELMNQLQASHKENASPG